MRKSQGFVQPLLIIIVGVLLLTLFFFYCYKSKNKATVTRKPAGLNYVQDIPKIETPGTFNVYGVYFQYPTDLVVKLETGVEYAYFSDSKTVEEKFTFSRGKLSQNSPAPHKSHESVKDIVWNVLDDSPTCSAQDCTPRFPGYELIQDGYIYTFRYYNFGGTDFKNDMLRILESFKVTEE